MRLMVCVIMLMGQPMYCGRNGFIAMILEHNWDPSLKSEFKCLMR